MLFAFVETWIKKVNVYGLEFSNWILVKFFDVRAGCGDNPELNRPLFGFYWFYGITNVWQKKCTFSNTYLGYLGSIASDHIIFIISSSWMKISKTTRNQLPVLCGISWNLSVMAWTNQLRCHSWLVHADVSIFILSQFEVSTRLCKISTPNTIKNSMLNLNFLIS